MLAGVPNIYSQVLVGWELVVSFLPPPADGIPGWHDMIYALEAGDETPHIKRENPTGCRKVSGWHGVLAENS